MIKRSEIEEAGIFNKPHGIKGEISATIGIDIDLNDVKCIVMDVEGIFVPFFITGVRPKTAGTSLVTIDGIDSDSKARELCGHPFYILRSDIPDDGAQDDTEGCYASDLIGYTLTDEVLGPIGEITGVNDLTENVLFIVTSPQGDDILVPVNGEFITGIDPASMTVTASLPQEIIDLNR